MQLLNSYFWCNNAINTYIFCLCYQVFDEANPELVFDSIKYFLIVNNIKLVYSILLKMYFLLFIFKFAFETAMWHAFTCKFTFLLWGCKDF